MGSTVAASYPPVTSDDTTDATTELETVWTDAALLTRRGAGIDDICDVREAVRAARFVAVTVVPQAGIDTRRTVDLMIGQDVQSMHR